MRRLLQTWIRVFLELIPSLSFTHLSQRGLGFIITAFRVINTHQQHITCDTMVNGVPRMRVMTLNLTGMQYIWECAFQPENEAVRERDGSCLVCM